MTNDETLIALLRSLAAAQLSLRDRLALTAMHAQLTKLNAADPRYCYRVADAMMAARMMPDEEGAANETD